jgi:hypothetical protein
MKSRNTREGHYCGCTTAPDGSGRRHIRFRTRQVSAGAAAKAVVARLVSEAEERRQMVLAAHIMAEDRHMLRELANADLVPTENSLLGKRRFS